MAEKNSCQSNKVGLGIVFGSMAGVLIGAITGEMGLWIAIGTAMGICFGAAFSNCESKDDEE
ncbi:MAG: hypothetical protein H8E91_07705 [Planctomycetes bacterium]|nr:hypothetical protein [Planctomycetota bacterium]